MSPLNRLSLGALMLLSMALGAIANPMPSQPPTKDPCAVVRCIGGHICKVIDGRAVCVPVELTPSLEKCGNVICPKGTSCCNASCSVCTPPGVFCTQQICSDTVALEERTTCGTAICGKGEFCCNSSCSICAPKGGGCPDVMCETQID